MNDAWKTMLAAEQQRAQQRARALELAQLERRLKWLHRASTPLLVWVTLVSVVGPLIVSPRVVAVLISVPVVLFVSAVARNHYGVERFIGRKLR